MRFLLPLLLSALLLPAAVLAAPSTIAVPDSGRIGGRFRAIIIDAAAGTALVISKVPPGTTISGSGWQMWGQEANTADGRRNRSFLGRFSYGAGLRATHFYTARAYDYEGRGGATGRSLHVGGSRLTALNAAGHIRFRLLGRADSRHPLTLGFNIDLTGVTFGPSSRSTRLAPNGQLEVRQIPPVRANLLLGNTNDRGTLNSEFYLNLRAAPRLNVRLAFGHLAAGYSFDGNRYQRFFNLAVVGVSYGLGSAGHYY